MVGEQSGETLQKVPTTRPSRVNGSAKSSAPTGKDVYNAIRDAFLPFGDATRAKYIQNYMKSKMPMLGIYAPEREQVFKNLRMSSNILCAVDPSHYVAIVKYIWKNADYREMRYAALSYAIENLNHAEPGMCLPLFEQMIIEGAWWDLVDVIAPKLVGYLLEDELASKEVNYRDEKRSASLSKRAKVGSPRPWTPNSILKESGMVYETILRWSTHATSMWLRRAALVAQLSFRRSTLVDTALQFHLCWNARLESDFFMRKAIGWSLRQLARSHMPDVDAFLQKYGADLSSLSFKQAIKCFPASRRNELEASRESKGGGQASKSSTKSEEPR